MYDDVFEFRCAAQTKGARLSLSVFAAKTFGTSSHESICLCKVLFLPLAAIEIPNKVIFCCWSNAVLDKKNA
jgi:hypothetical protein